MKIQVSLDEMQRRQIEEFRRATRSRLEARRCRIVLLLAEGKSIREICELVDCVRSTAYRTLYQFEEYGMDGLRDQRTKRKPHKATTEVREQLLNYLDKVPRDFGWQRSSWTLELLALQLARDTNVTLSIGHIRRVLKEEVFYVDEADVDLNPRIGLTYCQAPNLWSSAYESLWFHGVAVVLLRCGAVGGAERSEAEPQAPQRRAYSAGVR